MTDNDLNTVREDIAYVRGLAQDGRNAPLLNGPILIAASVIFGLASVCQYVIQSGRIDVSPWAQLWVWIAAGVVFAGALFLLIGRIKRTPGSGTLINKAVGSAWSGVGFGIFAVWLGMMGIGYSTGQWVVMAAMPTVVFAAYGTAWIVAGDMSGQRWMSYTGVAAYAGAALLGLSVASPYGYLVFTALLAACALIPGVILTRQASAQTATRAG